MKMYYWNSIKKSFFYDELTENIYLVHIFQEEKGIVKKDNNEVIARKEDYVLQDLNGKLIVIPKEETFRFKKVSRKFSFFRLNDINNSVLRLDKIKDYLLEIKEESEQVGNKTTIYKLVFVFPWQIEEYIYLNKSKMKEDKENLMYFLSVIERASNKTKFKKPVIVKKVKLKDN